MSETQEITQVETPAVPVAAETSAAPMPAPAFYPTATASLYVGELHPDVTESMLYELFSQVGTVASIRVCRDVVTRRSLGYAYVNFENTSDGERALETLNYTPIKGKPCRIMWSQRDPSVRRSGSGNVFIKNLDKSIDNKTLHDTFSAFGNILSCKVVCDENGSRGFGFVHFETQEAADSAIVSVNGMLLADKKVFVGHHVPRAERSSKIDEIKARFTNVYVKNFPEELDEQGLLDMFRPFGEVTSHVIQRDETGKSRCFGFVNFVNHDSAVAAIEALHETDQGEGRILTVCRAQSKSERDEELRRQYEAARAERNAQFQGVNLYVKNLDETITDEQLKTEFAAFGEITSLKIMRDDKGHSRGFGFVCFATPEEAQKGLEMNGKLMAGKPIYVAVAQRKEDRRSVLEAQYAQRTQLRYQQQQQQMMQQQLMLANGGMMHPAMMGGYPMYAAAGQAAAMSPNGPRMGMPYGGYAPRGRYVMQGGYGGRQQQGYYAAQQQQQPAQGGEATSPNATSPTGAPMMVPPHPQQMGGYNRRGGMGGGYRRGGGMGGQGYYQPRQPSGNGANSPPLGPNGQPMQSMPRRGGYGNGGYYRNGGVRGSLRAGTGVMDGQVPYGAAGYPVPTMQLTAAALAAATPEAQRRMLGERLYPLISAQEPVLAPKVTGMLIDMDQGELLHLLESPEALQAKVAEAVQLLKQHEQAAPPAPAAVKEETA